MEVIFKSKSLATTCNSRAKAVRKYGESFAPLIARRLTEMDAADNLADYMKVPGARCHPLTGDRKGQFAIDLKHPYRIIFEPADDPLALLPDGGLDLRQVRTVRILEVKVDYHGD